MKIEVKGANARVTERTLLTSGAVGLTCEFTFDRVWDGLMKTAVFRSGSVTRDVVNIETTVTVPHEVLAQGGQKLFVGVYGVNDSGDLAIPTVWVDMGLILHGADPSGDPGTDPTLPVWAQVMTDTVQTVPQDLTVEQQKQARENINAVSEDDVDKHIGELTEIVQETYKAIAPIAEEVEPARHIKYVKSAIGGHTGGYSIHNFTFPGENGYEVEDDRDKSEIYVTHLHADGLFLGGSSFKPTHKSVHCYLTDNSFTLEQDKAYLITGEDVSLVVTHADDGEVLKIGSTTGLMCICGRVGDTNERFAYGKFLYVTKILGVSTITSRCQPIYGDSVDATGTIKNKYTAVVSWTGAADVVEL